MNAYLVKESLFNASPLRTALKLQNAEPLNLAHTTWQIRFSDHTLDELKAIVHEQAHSTDEIEIIFLGESFTHPARLKR